jgi:four helix bundle protein
MLWWHMEEPHGLTEWSEQVPAVMRDDPIWRLPAYRYSLFLGDLIQADVRSMPRELRTRKSVVQLIDATLSISANIAEGYSRTTGPERAKFFEYAESSTRESRDWMFKLRAALGPDVATARILLATRIMKILIAVIPRERAGTNTRAREATTRRTDQASGAPSDLPDRDAAVFDRRPATSTSDQLPASGC